MVGPAHSMVEALCKTRGRLVVVEKLCDEMDEVKDEVSSLVSSIRCVPWFYLTSRHTPSPVMAAVVRSG